MKAMYFRFAFLLLFGLLPLLPEAQPVCGTVGEREEALVPRLQRNIAARRASSEVQPRSITYLPITFFLVARDEGFGRAAPGKVMDMLCRLNEDFTGMDIQFYIKEFVFLNHTGIYSNHNDYEFLMLALRDPAAINVWVLQDATPDIEIEGLVQGYYIQDNYQRDWIVMRTSEANEDATTLSHEMGHFFSLVHPFRGWDTEPYDAAVHGDPAPAVSPGGQDTELMSGANCETAADMLCDTPPDYNFGFGWMTCEYQGALDPEGEPVDPEERLIMSYFNQCERDEYFFSDEQRAVILQDLFTEQRDYIRAAGPPANLGPVAGPVTLLAPADESGISDPGSVDFSWTPAAGADAYLLEIDVVVTFNTPLLRRLIVTDNNWTVTGLQNDRTYYWRVRPFNSYQACTEFSELNLFYTGQTVGLSQAGSNLNWSVAPNPAAPGGQLTLDLAASTAFTARIELTSVLGRPIQDWGTFRFQAGANRRQLSLPADLPPGWYLVNLHGKEQRSTRKLVISR